MKALKLSWIVFAALGWGTAWAVPGVINYQGRLTDALNKPITVTTNVTFTFWDAATGGNQLGSGFSDTDAVTPDGNGMYSTEVGDDPGNPIPASVFSGDSVWLNVNVGGEDLAPRMRVDSAGFALHAAAADTAGNSAALQGLPPSAFLNMSSDAYMVVKTTPNATQNGANLLAAYGAAKGLAPNGAALSSTNRAVVLVPPGRYDLGTGELTLDTEFVDVIGLSSKRGDQSIFGTSNGPGTGVIRQTADDVGIENLLVECRPTSGSLSPDATAPAAYFPDSVTTDTVIRNCEFRGDGAQHSWSMRARTTYSGTYIDCTGGSGCFGGWYGTASGSFTNCTCGSISFGGLYGTASGTFSNCTGGPNCFGGYMGTASGTFTNCTGGANCFGGPYGTASGTFTNCTGGDESFGGSGVASGAFTQCSGGKDAFGGSGVAGGTFTRCAGGEWSFGGWSGTADGVFTDCTGDAYAFGGGFNGVASGRFTGCSGGDYAFGGGPSTSGGTASGGKFYHCVGGADAFTESGSPAPIHLFCIQNGAQFSGNN